MFKKVLFIVLGVIFAAIIGFLLMGWLNPTYKHTVIVTVDAPASKTFAVFNDTTQMRKWMPNFRRIKNISGLENEVGSKWEIVFDENGRELIMTETVIAFEQDKHFAFELDDSFAIFQFDIRFDEVNGKTIITETSSGAGKSLPARSMIAIMKGSIKGESEKIYGNLKTLVESSR